jgi:hypothetical protein
VAILPACRLQIYKKYIVLKLTNFIVSLNKEIKNIVILTYDRLEKRIIENGLKWKE